MIGRTEGSHYVAAINSASCRNKLISTSRWNWRLYRGWMALCVHYHQYASSYTNQLHIKVQGSQNMTRMFCFDSIDGIIHKYRLYYSGDIKNIIASSLYSWKAGFFACFASTPLTSMRPCYISTLLVINHF